MALRSASGAPILSPMKDGKDNGTRPAAVKPPGKPAAIVKRGADLGQTRPRAPRPPGKPVAIVKKGIG